MADQPTCTSELLSGDGPPSPNETYQPCDGPAAWLLEVTCELGHTEDGAVCIDCAPIDAQGESWCVQCPPGTRTPLVELAFSKIV